MTRVEDLLPEVAADQLPRAVTDRRANWIEVARKDVLDARRSWVFWSLGGLFVMLVLLAGTTHVFLFPKPSEVQFSWGLGSIAGLVIQWFVPLSALVFGAVAIVGEREAGSLRVLLGLSITRRDVVIGKLLGRSAVFSVMLLIGVAIGGVESWYLYAGFALGAYTGFVIETLLLGWIFVGIGVGFSALFRSRARAVGASMGVFALVSIVWRVVPDGVFYLVEGKFPGDVRPPWDPPAWFIFLGNLNPVDGTFAVVQDSISPHSDYLRTLAYRRYSVEPPGPFYLQPEFLLLVLALWALVPLALGAWRFSRRDLG